MVEDAKSVARVQEGRKPAKPFQLWCCLDGKYAYSPSESNLQTRPRRSTRFLVCSVWDMAVLTYFLSICTVFLMGKVDASGAGVRQRYKKGLVSS